MKPRNKLQKTVLELSRQLPALSDYQKQQAIKKVAPHIAKLDSKGEYTCMDCGHTWKDRENRSTNIICPHCSSKLTIKKNRKRKIILQDYFAVITKRAGFQVIRMFLLCSSLHKGKSASYCMGEAFQRWITSDGREAIVSRKRYGLSFYVDSWDWCSDLEIRQEHDGHLVMPSEIVGHISAIPELIRNGFNGNFHGFNPYRVIISLLTNSKVETMWKAGQFELARYFMYSTYALDGNWPSIKIAIRNNYIVRDASLWCDLLSALDYLGKDTRNPKFICPENLRESHDYWVHKRAVHEDRIRHQNELQRELDKEREYLSDTAKIIEDEAKYKEAKSQYFGLEFKDCELTIKPLTSIREFIDEWHTLHHCVFTNKYYQKEQSLILHALIDGNSVATIELDINNLEILQCRGAHNSIPPLKERIITLIELNKYQIAQRRAA